MPSFGQFEERVRRKIAELETAGLQRKLQPPSGIDLSSNDYLGLASHPLMKEKTAAAVLSEGTGSTASRLLRGERPALSQVEKRFAAFKNTEASLYFGSGYAANLSVLSTFAERNDIVLTDTFNHASIHDGIRLSRARRVKFQHCDVDDAARLLKAAPSGVQKFLITESLFSMDGDFAPLAAYAQLCRETNTILLVDEAHAVGVYGQRGSGRVEETGTAEAVLASIDTAGKAMGVAGAFVSGPAWAVDYLIQRARPFMFSTAPPPALAAALDTSLSLIESEPERRRRVKELSSTLRTMLRDGGADIGRSESQIVPIFLGENGRAKSVAEDLQDEGFDVRPIRPPAVPAGTARLRISVNALLEDSTLRHFVDSVQRITSCSAVSS